MKIKILTGLLVLALLSGCSSKLKTESAAQAVKTAFQLSDKDHVEILGITDESRDVKIIKYAVNEKQSTARIRNYDGDWHLDEIQNELGTWNSVSASIKRAANKKNREEARQAASAISPKTDKNGGPEDALPLVHETLRDAAEKGDLADVKRHLKLGEDVNAKDNFGETPLFLAAFNGHKDVAELMIAKGAAVNVKAKNNATPLHYAAMQGHAAVAELLIAKGADVNAKNQRGLTPLALAEIMGREDVIELLKKHGAK